jgi:hypothetical protein
MTTPNDILRVAQENGWARTPGTLNHDSTLSLVRLPEPGIPQGGSRYGLWIEFDFDTQSRVIYAEKHVGSTDTRLLGGAQAIKKYLRENGWKA